MSEVNALFEKASRQKLRFLVALGGIYNTEDLWDLPLQSENKASLDGIWKGIKKELRELVEESFVSNKPAGNVYLELKLSIVEHIITVKKAEAEIKAKAAANKVKKEKIMSLIAQKKDQELSAAGVEDLEKMLQELGE